VKSWNWLAGLITRGLGEGGKGRGHTQKIVRVVVAGLKVAGYRRWVLGRPVTSVARPARAVEAGGRWSYCLRVFRWGRGWH